MKPLVTVSLVTVSFLSGLFINQAVAVDRLGRINGNVSAYVARAQQNQNTVDACYGVVTELIVENVKQKKMLGITE